VNNIREVDLSHGPGFRPWRSYTFNNTQTLSYVCLTKCTWHVHRLIQWALSTAMTRRYDTIRYAKRV